MVSQHTGQKKENMNSTKEKVIASLKLLKYKILGIWIVRHLSSNRKQSLQYVEDILTRMMNGDDDYRSMIPCYYTPGKKQEKKVA